MSGAKKLEELTEEELAQYLESETLPELPETNTVLEFIQRFDLQPGEKRVSAALLHRLYQKYYPRISQYLFTKEMINYLPYDTNSQFRLNTDNVLLRSELAKKPVKQRQRAETTSVSSYWLNTHFNAFFESIGLTQGDSRINWWVLYELYLRDCKARNYRRPKTAKVFQRFISFHFKSLASETGPIYLVNHSVCLLINKGEYAEIQEKFYPKENTQRKLPVPRRRKKRKS